MQIVIMNGGKTTQEKARLTGHGAKTPDGEMVLEFVAEAQIVRLVLDKADSVDVIARIANALRNL